MTDNKLKPKVIFMLIGVIIITYISLISVFVGSTNELLIDVSNSDTIQQRAYIVEEDLTLMGYGQFGSFPIFGNYLGIDSYNGTSIPDFLNNGESDYYVTILTGTFANTTVRLAGLYLSFNVAQLMINYSNNELLQNEYFEIYKANNNNPIRGFSSVYDNIFMGVNDLHIAYDVSGSLSQPLLYWDGKGSFVAGKLYNYGMTLNSNSIGNQAVGIGSNLVVSGRSSVAINGWAFENAFFSSGIGGGAVYEPQSVSIGVTTAVSSRESVGIGKQATIKTDSKNSVVIGSGSTLYDNSSYSMILGNSNSIGTYSQPNDVVGNNIVIGNCGNIQDNTISSMFFSNCNQYTGGLVNNYFNENFSIGFAISKTPITSKEMGVFDFNKGLLVGAYTGNTMPMTGDDFYVKDNAQIHGSLVVGSNTVTGLADGDINASTIYYDTLTAKSPIMMCSLESLKCFIMDVEAEKEYYVTIDENYNIIDAINKDDKKKVEVTQKVKDKLTKLKLKKDDEQARNEVINTCESLNGTYSLNGCYKISEQLVNYEQAVQKIDNPIYSYKDITISKLNKSMHEVTETTKVQDRIINYQTEYIFRTDCGWNEKKGYYCSVIEKLNI